MPQRDGTGPDGEGPNTGRGMGPCEETEEVQTTLDEFTPEEESEVEDEEDTE